MKLFIDGSQGTTGLRIERLCQRRKDIELLCVDPELRKDLDARREIYAKADAVILCLPEDASKEACEAAEGLPCKILDTSTAFRVEEGWAYGLPELGDDYEEKIKRSDRVANPGCYATGFNLSAAPLVREGWLKKETRIHVFAVSGYSGGGKKMIKEFEGLTATEPAFFLYALDQRHKHLPEMRKHSGLTRNPVFQPSVAPAFNGMLVVLQIDREDFKRAVNAEMLTAFYGDYFAERPLVRSRTVSRESVGRFRLDLRFSRNSSCVDIFCFDGEDHVEIVASLDNLGKGAAEAALQNFNLMTDPERPYEGLL